jgi:alpha-glucosidase
MGAPFLWWRDGVIYQVYPRSFADSNGDGIGDLNGILGRLDYLSDLGVDAVWLSPIYPSPGVDFGYDVSNYTAIDPIFGTMADFDRLLKAAHERGIRIILDLVLNHTSDRHPWFQAARSSRSDPHHDWYLWRDKPANKKYPNNWCSFFGGPGWEPVTGIGQYYFHMFCKEQPDVNWRNPHLRQAMLDIFHFWLERGVDGFRLDVFNAYFKQADLNSNPLKFGLRSFDRQVHVNDINQPEMIPLLAEIRSIADAFTDRYVVGETFISSPEISASYCGSDKLHAAFNFDLIQARWQPGSFLRSVLRWQQTLSADAWPNHVLNNHDNRRSAIRFGRGESDERLKVAAAFLLTLRGTPFLYYGEEIGMRDIHLDRSMIKDPVGRQYWPFHKGRDGCRAPMQWDASDHSGFSSARPWLPLNPDFQKRNVEAQKNDSNSLLNFYRQLIAIRRTYPALQQGTFLPLTYEPHIILGYLRQTSTQTLLVALNFSRTSSHLVLGGQLASCHWQLLLSNKKAALAPIRSGLLPLEGEEASILLQTS